MTRQLSPGHRDQVNSQSNATENDVMVKTGQTFTRKSETTWAEIVKDRDGDFAADLSDKVNTLFNAITTALVRARDSSSDATTATVLAIEAFLFELEGDDEKKHIDHCILWLLLYRAAKIRPERSKSSGGADEIVFKMIIKRDPYLAFDNPHVPTLSFGEDSEYKPIKDQCPIWTQQWKTRQQKNRELHFQDKPRSTPFHQAAKHGNFAIIKLIKESLASIDKANHGPVYKVIQSVDPGDKKKTALQHAAEAEHGSVESLSVLLGFDCIANSDQLDAAFASAVKDGAENVVNAFLDQAKLKERFVKSKHILTAIEQISPASKPAGRQRYMAIIKKLIELAIPAEPLTDEVVESIIEHQSIATRELQPEQDSKAQSELTQLGWMDIWKAAQARPEGVLRDVKSKLLHLAVYHQSLSFVNEFLEHPEYSKSATIPETLPRSSKRGGTPTKDEHFPLWYNSKVWNDQKSAWDDRDGSATIRTMLVSSTIRQTRKMQQLSDIFYKSGQPVRELCFDISRFDSKLYRVSTFVYSLIHHSENENLLSYEETIRYAEFPALDLKAEDRETFGDNSYLAVQHTEVFDILTWLRKQKRVQRIVELKVPDRLVNPHDEQCIAKFVDMFEVEVLDWRCLDLSLSVLNSHAASDKTKVPEETKFNDKIKELHLYSSGRRAAIDHWLGSDGIPTLTKLEKLHIHIVRETVTEEYCKKIIFFISAGLDKMKEKYAGRSTCNFKLNYGTVDSVFWNPTHTLVDLDEIAHRVTPRLAKFLKSLSDFVPVREKQIGQELRRTRVAIIDNGILSITPRSYDKAGDVRGRENKGKVKDGAATESPGAKGNPGLSSGKEKITAGLEDDQKHENPGRKSLWSRIETGRSFVDDGSKVSPWLFASDSHGTQMANLICAMDPFCELYVARVAEGKYGITPDRAARAIEWALEKEVDIISMSIALLDPGNGILKHWVDKANAKGVIIVCSTHDEGTRTPTSYPAMWKSSVIVITACDEYGRLLRESDKEQYHYKVQGHNVAAGVIPFVESSQYITGSSVSTALAAGLSSLILTCHKVAHLHEKKTETENKQKAPPLDKNMDSPVKFPYAEGQPEKVIEELNKMATDQHVMLEKFGEIDSTTKEGDEIYADKILHKFGLPK